MSNIIIPASKSLTVTNKSPKENINSNHIKVGYHQKFKYISYLFFDISSIPPNAKILSAKLVLFKTNNFYEGNIPFIDIKYKVYCISCCDGEATIREVNVTGTVAPESKYMSILNVEVKRDKSNKVGNYYIADEYDNSSGVTPLKIDKNYKVVIIPKERKGDTEKVNLYGSYKEDKKT